MNPFDTSSGATPPTPFASHHPFEGMGREAVPGETELRNRAFLVAGGQRLMIVTALLLPLLMLVAVVLHLLAAAGGEAQSIEELLGELQGRVWQELAEDSMQLLMLGATLVLSSLSVVHGVRERVFLGPDGIRYVTGLPWPLSLLRPSWSVRRDQIRALRIAPSMFGTAPSVLHFEVDTGASTHKLLLYGYVDPDDYRAKEFRGLAALRADREDLASLFETLPLVRYGRELGFALALPETAAAEAGAQTSLTDTPRLAAALLFVFVAFGYAVVDMGLLGETYAAGAPLPWIVGGGLGVGGLGWWLLGDEELSPPVRAGMAVLVAVIAMLALYPGFVRLNAIGAEDARPYAYRHGEAGTLEPVEAGSPALDLPDLVELLGSQPGDVHELWIRRGSLGFYQVDIDRLEEAFATGSPP